MVPTDLKSRGSRRTRKILCAQATLTFEIKLGHKASWSIKRSVQADERSCRDASRRRAGTSYAVNASCKGKHSARNVNEESSAALPGSNTADVFKQTTG